MDPLFENSVYDCSTCVELIGGLVGAVGSVAGSCDHTGHSDHVMLLCHVIIVGNCVTTDSDHVGTGGDHVTL